MQSASKLIISSILSCLVFEVQAQSLPDSLVLKKIKSAAAKQSVISTAITNLADIYGPRLLGTDQYYKSAQWSKQQLLINSADTAWFESFDQQYRGWKLHSFNVEMTSPSYMHIAAYPLAYSKSSNGTVMGDVVLLRNIDSLSLLKGKLKGKILLLCDGFRPVNNTSSITSQRISKDQLLLAADNPDPNDLMIGYHSRRSTLQAITSQEKRREALSTFFQLCEKEGVAALIEPSDYPYGILHIDGNNHIPSYRKNNEITPVPSFVIANEHFGRLVRLVEHGTTPKLRFHVDAVFNFNPEYNVNVIADIKGTDKILRDEQVIMGAHLDSWHGGTGAVDNAAGVAVMMEAMRLLKAADLKPKRTIRIALWGGEEQVFAGSRMYTEKRVGSLINGSTRPDYSKISAYFNLDNGTGKIRGIYAQGNSAVKPLFENFMAPFAASGNGTVTLQNANQTDHELFDALNIPAFQFIQDPLNYISAVHHTNLDVAEYVNKQDLQESAVMVAYLLYKVAMHDSLLPRREHISIEPSLKGNTRFFLKGFENAGSVSIVSDFNNWNMFGTPLKKVAGGWTCSLNLKPGRYLFKYIVDGDWTNDPQTPTDKLLRDGKGHAGLTEIIVK